MDENNRTNWGDGNRDEAEQAEMTIPGEGQANDGDADEDMSDYQGDEDPPAQDLPPHRGRAAKKPHDNPKKHDENAKKLEENTKRIQKLEAERVKLRRQITANKKKFEDEISKLTQSTTELTDEKAVLTSKQIDLERENKDLKDEVSRLHAEVDEVQVLLTESRSECNELMEQITANDSLTDDPPQAQGLAIVDKVTESLLKSLQGKIKWQGIVESL
jgi:chromosome segregation ATPase